jgi:hypothetical protein
MQLYEGRQLDKTNDDYIGQRNARRSLGILTDGQLVYYPSLLGKSVNVVSYSIEIKNKGKNQYYVVTLVDENGKTVRIHGSYFADMQTSRKQVN